MRSPKKAPRWAASNIRDIRTFGLTLEGIHKKGVMDKLEIFLYHFLILSVSISTAITFIGLPALLCHLAVKNLLDKGIDVILIGGFFSIIIVIYSSVIEFILKYKSNKKPIIENVLYICANVGSVLLVISMGLFVILLLSEP